MGPSNLTAIHLDFGFPLIVWQCVHFPSEYIWQMNINKLIKLYPRMPATFKCNNEVARVENIWNSGLKYWIAGVCWAWFSSWRCLHHFWKKPCQLNCRDQSKHLLGINTDSKAHTHYCQMMWGSLNDFGRHQWHEWKIRHSEATSLDL